jgi:mannose-1-phosphate guanylyltransferase / mannose-6-phosphate isomerase
MKLQPVILCGGSGTRLWPLSREQHPKQLLPIESDKTMLQVTACRLDASLARSGCTVLPPIIVANEDYRFITAEQLRQAGVTPAALVLESTRRNTAPALTLAALIALKSDGDPVLVAMPADHVIVDVAAFHAGVVAGARHAEAGKIVTFGIEPTRAETGYGYIETGKTLGPDDAGAELIAFVEKPDAATAARYVESGNYLWNSGIFMVRASVWLARLGELRPEILSACRAAVEAGSADSDFFRVGAGPFSACRSESIDNAVMEHLPAGTGVVIPLSAGWSDVGAWDALWQIGAKDNQGNVLRGDVVAVDTHDTLVISGSRLVACVGLDNMVVVETPDAVLAVHQRCIQQVKDIVAQLKRAGRTEADVHRKIHRPWGYFDSIDAGSRFQVKRIVVNPGAALSLQMHHHRAEHWVVVRGTARVRCGDKSFLLSENESTYIPIGTLHRLENPGKVPLEIIEVQSGAYLGEDDIVRYEDTYGRS